MAEADRDAALVLDILIAAHDLFALEARPTAVFCLNDEMATGVYTAAREAGLRIPEDVSVVG